MTNYAMMADILGLVFDVVLNLQREVQTNKLCFMGGAGFFENTVMSDVFFGELLGFCAR